MLLHNNDIKLMSEMFCVNAVYSDVLDFSAQNPSGNIAD